MPNEYRGTPIPLRQRFNERFSPTNGWTAESEYRGFDLNQVRAYYNYFAAAGCEVELDYGNGMARLHAVDTSGNFTIDTWQILQNETNPSSLENPYNIAAMSETDLVKVARALQTGEALPVSVTDDSAKRLYDRMFLGSTTYYKSGYVLRHTTNVSNRWNINVSDIDVDCIYTTAQLLSETQDVFAWIFPLPGRLAYKLNSIYVPPFRANYLFGWLKRGSTETTCANNRVDIVTEYWLDQWSLDEYASV